MRKKITVTFKSTIRYPITHQKIKSKDKLTKLNEAWVLHTQHKTKLVLVLNIHTIAQSWKFTRNRYFQLCCLHSKLYMNRRYLLSISNCFIKHEVIMFTSSITELSQNESWQDWQLNNFQIQKLSNQNCRTDNCHICFSVWGEINWKPL